MDAVADGTVALTLTVGEPCGTLDSAAVVEVRRADCFDAVTPVACDAEGAVGAPVETALDGDAGTAVADAIADGVALGATFRTVIPPVVCMASRAGSADAECSSRTLIAAAAVPTASTPTTDMAVATWRRRLVPRMALTVRRGVQWAPPATAKNR